MQISSLNIKYHVLVFIIYRSSRGVEEKERVREKERKRKQEKEDLRNETKG